MNKFVVLVVEDDKLILNLMTTTLGIHNYKYLTAASASDALLQITSHNPDVIFLDLGLPDMDGVDLIRKIRTWSSVPIIVISARSEDTDKIEALDAGADDYLTKPFSVDELLARLRVTQRRLAAASQANMNSHIFENGDLKVDFAAGTAYMNGEELALTPIEYKLLCLFCKNIGKTLTHTYLTDAPQSLHGVPQEKNRKRHHTSSIYTDQNRRRIQNEQALSGLYRRMPHSLVRRTLCANCFYSCFLFLMLLL